MGNYPRFSDFSQEEKRLEGTKMRIQEILNKEILVTGYTINQSHYPDGKSDSKNYLALQFELDGEQHIVFTGSAVLTDQIARYKENIPFYTIIKHIDRYYTFT
jgi:hypothetical protein